MPIKLAKIKKKLVYALGKCSVKQALQVGIEIGTCPPSPGILEICIKILKIYTLTKQLYFQDVLKRK